MRSRTRAISLLALGLALALSHEAAAAPSTPPPPVKRAATPPPPSTGTTGTTGSPFLPTSRKTTTSPSAPGTASSPPPPPAAVVDEPDGPDEPEPPPQDLSNTWGYSRSRAAIQPRYVRTNDPAFAAPNPVGFYSGVSVDGNQAPPFPAKQKGTTPVLMTWTGFERVPEGGGSRVFFQLSAEANYDVQRDGQTIRLRMRNTKANVRNNMRHLDLRYFETPVRTVKLRRKGRDTVATIVLKRLAEPEIQLVDGKGGYKLLVVQFVDGGGVDEPSAEPPPPPPP